MGILHNSIVKIHKNLIKLWKILKILLAIFVKYSIIIIRKDERGGDYVDKKHRFGRYCKGCSRAA